MAELSGSFSPNITRRLNLLIDMLSTSAPDEASLVLVIHDLDAAVVHVLELLQHGNWKSFLYFSHGTTKTQNNYNMIGRTNIYQKDIIERGLIYEFSQ